MHFPLIFDIIEDAKLSNEYVDGNIDKKKAIENEMIKLECEGQGLMDYKKVSKKKLNLN